MKQKLAMLVELQTVDDSLRDLRQTHQELVRLVNENHQSLDVFDRMLRDLGERITETRAFYAEKEEEVKETEANIARSRNRLGVITSQKELTALNKELEASRKANQQRNDELMRLYEQLETAQADFAQKTADRDALAREMEQVETTLRDRIQTQEAGLTELNGRRARLRESLPRDLLSKYERIAKARNGQGVADVPDDSESTEGRRGPTCGGCNMSVPPQVYIRLQRMETLEQCANCSRILVYRRGLVDGERVGLSE